MEQRIGKMDKQIIKFLQNYDISYGEIEDLLSISPMLDLIDYKEFIDYMNNCPVIKANIFTANSKWEYSTTEQIVSSVNKLLGGRILNQLSKNEIKDLILNLHKSVKCKMIQIASVLHVDYKFVKDCIREAPQPE